MLLSLEFPDRDEQPKSWDKPWCLLYRAEKQGHLIELDSCAAKRELSPFIDEPRDQEMEEEGLGDGLQFPG